VKCLALDIASATGAAIDHPDGARPICTTYRLPDVGGPDDHGPRLEAFEEWLCDQLDVHAPDLVAYEAPLVPHGEMKTTAATVLLLIKLVGVAELVAARYGCRRKSVNVSTVKKQFCGHGRADKAAVVARCAQLRWPVCNDHEADAAGVWCYAKSISDPGFAPKATPLFTQGRP
jgi:Holliday junction resolvasome RuvABC endonuclease subunit